MCSRDRTLHPTACQCQCSHVCRRKDVLIAGLKAAGHKAAHELKIADRDHVSIVRRMPEPNDPAYTALRDFILRAGAPETPATR
jgi:hypothetical protein